MQTEREIYADANSAIARLRNNGVIVDTEAKLIEVGPKTGIKLWGAIDYLQNHVKGYTWFRKAY